MSNMTGNQGRVYLLSSEHDKKYLIKYFQLMVGCNLSLFAKSKKLVICSDSPTPPFAVTRTEVTQCTVPWCKVLFNCITFHCMSFTPLTFLLLFAETFTSESNEGYRHQQRSFITFYILSADIRAHC